ncbi:hypothetical protein N7452_002583 [Penicillium brevicompactum]|uniref:Zn(2)-C6 fungal-type domain-containing protein n=1 Tax=Penicillium brevicompactum TaxID=5074 RepID=A0A9W9QTF1_PENBR|nr:hypothetical protein N7452_002583 [Penicillium brevicompactum]
MVNRGRSGGCLTCKQRRVKCDETKPECQACHRLKLRCGGYRAKNTLKFKDQNHKFCNQDVGCRSRNIVENAVSGRSSESDVREHKVMGPLASRLSEPDTAVSFYLSHYASMGRDMGSTRGFFELIIPAYRAEREDSVLSLAVSALASEILSLWRQDPSSFRSPRKSYSRAITRLRNAIQDPIERSKPATILAVLVLQTYENASAIYDLRRVSSTHHNGAASLLSSLNPHDMDKITRAYLQKFMLHTEVSTAIRQKKPLNSIAYSWLESKESTTVPQNPSSILDALGASVAELQARYSQFVQQGGLSMTSLGPCMKEWIADAKRVDAELLGWSENVPHHWRPVRLISGRDIDSSIPTYQSVCDVYPSCQIASIWNLWRFQRILLAKIKLSSLGVCSGNGCTSFADGHVLYDHADLIDCRQTLQETVDSVCYSIPFYLGNRNTRSNLSDFTDPMILLPSQYSLKETRLDNNGLEPCLSKDDHRRHVIAQGPWRAMHPLSHLLTLFSEDHSEPITRVLRSGQQEWVRDQFLRVTKLLHLPSSSGNDIERSESTKSNPDGNAEYLAKGVRKGAILMSGP